MTIHTLYSNGNPPTTRDRSAGGPLDRHEWARTVTRTLPCSSIARSLLLELCFWAGPDGRCWPSQSLLAAELHLTSRSVRRALVDLVDCGALTVEVSGKGSRSTNTYRLAGYTTGWVSKDTMSGKDSESYGYGLRVLPVRTESPTEPCIEPYNEPCILQVEETDDAIPTPKESLEVEEPKTSDVRSERTTATTATQPTLTAQPVKASKPRKRTPKVKQEPSVSERFIAAMVEKYPGLDVSTEVNAALNHKAAQNYYPDHEPYVGNWLRRSAEWAKERNGKPKSTRPQIKADWKEYDFFGEEKQENV